MSSVSVGFATLAGVNKNYSQPRLSSGNCSVYYFLVVLFLVDLFYTCSDEFLAKDPKDPSVMLWSSFFAALTSPVLCPTVSSHLGLSKLQTLFSQLKVVIDEIVGLSLFVFFL